MIQPQSSRKKLGSLLDSNKTQILPWWDIRYVWFTGAEREFQEDAGISFESIPKSWPTITGGPTFERTARSVNAPIYTLEVFMKKGTNIEKMRDTILQGTGTIPSIHDGSIQS